MPNRMYRDRPNLPDNLPAGAVQPDTQRREFARRLASALIERGWSQTELASRASELMPPGQKLEKYSVSVYVSGKSFPEPMRLDAICRALGVPPSSLVPGYEGIGRLSGGARSLEVSDAGDGMMWLIVHKRLPLSVVLDVLKLINEAETAASDKNSI